MNGTWLRKPDTSAPTLVVIFIHGFLSSTEKCWQHKNGARWPNILQENASLGNTGIYEFSYNTEVFSGSYNLGDVVDALKASLSLDKVIDACRIVFVAHSMGGIVARRYVVQEQSEFIARGTELGMFLVASPSLGSNYAKWFSPIAKLLGHSQARALEFCESNTWLNDLNKDFRNLWTGRKLVLNGKELIEDKFVILKFLGFIPQIVPPLSGAIYFEDAFKVPASDHSSIAKPDSADAIQNRLLCKFIEDFMQTKYEKRKVSYSNDELKATVGDCDICIVFGKIEDYPFNTDTVVALPSNEYFDDRCTEDSRSALGSYVTRHFNGRASEFSNLVRTQCTSSLSPGIDQQRTSDQVNKSFGAGRSLLLLSPLKHAISVALISTTTQRAGQGLTASFTHLLNGIRELFQQLADQRLNEVAMPILGAGHGGIDPPRALTGLLLALAEASQYQRGKQRRKVKIVIYKKSINDPSEVSTALARQILQLMANDD